MIEVKVVHVTNSPIALMGVNTVKVVRYQPTRKIVNLQYRPVNLENVVFDGENVIFDGEQVVA